MNDLHHGLKITGPEAELDRFVAECFREGAGDPELELKKGRLELDFNKIVPMPAGLADSSKEVDYRGHRLPEWHAWSWENWGTHGYAYWTELKRKSERELELTFYTAGARALPIYDELAKRFPRLTIDGFMEDPNYPLCATVHCHAGEFDYDEDE